MGRADRLSPSPAFELQKRQDEFSKRLYVQKFAWEFLTLLVLINALAVVMAGDNGVGKTSLITRFTRNEFHADPHATVGIDVGIRTVPYSDGTTLLAQMWDLSHFTSMRILASCVYPSRQKLLTL